MQASSLSGFALHAAKQMAGAVWLGNDDYEENSERCTGWCVLPVCPHVLSIWTARRRCFCRMICMSYDLKRLFTLKNLAAAAFCVEPILKDQT